MIIERVIISTSETRVDAALEIHHGSRLHNQEVTLKYRKKGVDTYILEFDVDLSLIGHAQAEEYADIVYQEVAKSVS